MVSIRLTLLITTLLSSPYQSECARILGIFAFAARSHYILGNSLMKGLAEAGNDVTMISPFEDKIPPSNGSYRNIVLKGFAENYTNLLKQMDLFEFSNKDAFSSLFLMKNMFLYLLDEVFSDENVKMLLNSNETFDAVVVEQFANDAIKFFAYRFQAPLIVLSPVGASIWVSHSVGNPSPLAYVPHIVTDYAGNMTFVQRLNNVLVFVFEKILDYFSYFPKNDEILKRHFPSSPNTYDLYHNVSLVLLNSHESLNQAVPTVPNMIGIGGYHVKPPKKLPKDLQEFLDSSKEGVVYFSLGSNLKSKDLAAHKREALLKAFSKLKEKVLWKWEEDVLPDQPPNVKLGKWFPQQDILGHPNIKLFITHGGLLSTTEAVYHGVPLLAIPVFGDQYLNAKTAVANGYALSLPYRDPSFLEENLSYMLDELLHNPKYINNVKQKSQLFHDRPMKPMEAAVYWVEYVIRHKGAPHLRVAGLNLPWYQYLLLDVVLFLATSTIVTLTLLYLAIKKVYSALKSTSAKTVKRKKND